MNCTSDGRGGGGRLVTRHCILILLIFACISADSYGLDVTRTICAHTTAMASLATTFRAIAIVPKPGKEDTLHSAHTFRLKIFHLLI